MLEATTSTTFLSAVPALDGFEISTLKTGHTG
jgi:hypothetical protein